MTQQPSSAGSRCSTWDTTGTDSIPDLQHCSWETAGSPRQLSVNAGDLQSSHSSHRAPGVPVPRAQAAASGSWLAPSFTPSSPVHSALVLLSVPCTHSCPRESKGQQQQEPSPSSHGVLSILPQIATLRPYISTIGISSFL